MDGDKYNLLEQILIDSNKEPTDLPLSLLKAITNNFSEDQKIGSGGFADVYKGILDIGYVVAVKRLSQAINMDESNFNKEVTNLIRVKHPNVVRFLGYCSDTQGKVEKCGEKIVMADLQQRLLCFEFLPNFSLDRHINNVASGGLEWRTWYQIIKGLCRGLHYLHQQNIVHLDLKPANILLDSNMAPKISDFGLSRCFEEKQTRAVTAKLVGTLGYIAPEFINSGVITIKSDIYSLGIIIIEILTGQKGYIQTESVLESWSTRFQMSHGGWLEHVRVCANIGLECIDSDPMKRPTTRQIIERLDELECTHGFIETNHYLHHFEETNYIPIPMVDVYPLDIWFPLESDKVIKCPVTLTNKTDDFVGVWIVPTSLDECSNLRYVWYSSYISDTESSYRTGLEPHSSGIIYLTMRKQEQPPLEAADKGMFDVMMIPIKSEEGRRKLLGPGKGPGMPPPKDPLKYARKFGIVVRRATVRAAVTSDPARWQEVAAHQFIQAEPDRNEHGNIFFMDVHPTQTWLLLGYSSGHVSIWNYETEERVTKFEVKRLIENSYSDGIKSVKFIAGEEWFAAGDGRGVVHVYAYTGFRAENDKIKEFEAHVGNDRGVTELAVYPKHTLLLTASSHDTSIKLWDWSQGWTCARVIDTDSYVCDVKVGPRDASIFACSHHGSIVQVWDIHSPVAIARLEGSTPTLYKNNHRNFLAIIDGYAGYAKIWDLQTKKQVHRLCMGSYMSFCNFALHPTLPIFAAIMSEYTGGGKKHNVVILWDVRTYRVMKRVDLLMEDRCPKIQFDGAEDITSLVVATNKEISIIKINVAALCTGRSK